jgi:3-oxoacyl-[acyl-carrier protein] reductase
LPVVLDPAAIALGTAFAAPVAMRGVPNDNQTGSFRLRDNLLFDFAGQTVIVTGGAQGIGLELGRFFQKARATVYLVDFDGDGVQNAAASIGARAHHADVASTDEVNAAVDRIIGETGRVDILVNNAGILRDNVLWKLTDEDWEQVLAVHVGGTFRFTRACTPHFREKQFGRVINVTSYTGLRGNTGQANYAAAKAGIIGFTKTAAKELARFGVTVNAVSPNAETRMIASIPEEKRQELTAAIPMRRFAQPEEMAAAVGFLASKEAGYVTGIVLAVDGGISM